MSRRRRHKRKGLNVFGFIDKASKRVSRVIRSKQVNKTVRRMEKNRHKEQVKRAHDNNIFNIADKTMKRAAKVINSKEAAKVVKVVKPIAKTAEEHRHQEAMVRAAHAKGGGGILGDLFDSPLLGLLTNPFVLGGLAGAGGLIALKIAL